MGAPGEKEFLAETQRRKKRKDLSRAKCAKKIEPQRTQRTRRKTEKKNCILSPG
jgi:hypothetical protein